MIEKKKIGFTAGNFDLLHPGYIITFEEAKKHCDLFYIFLQKSPLYFRKWTFQKCPKCNIQKLFYFFINQSLRTFF